MGKYSNVIRVESTGRKVSIAHDGALVDVEEFKVISCDVEPEKGTLIYDVNAAAAKFSEHCGMKTPTTGSVNVQIGSRRFVTEQELGLMKKKNVKVIISERLTCSRRNTSCEPKKAPSGGCAGCEELTRKIRNMASN